MKTVYGVSVWLAGVLLLAGCGNPPVLDGNTEERFQQSMTEIEKTLSPGEREKFRAAVALIRARDTARWQERGEREAAEIARVQMTGMTAREVIQKSSVY